MQLYTKTSFSDNETQILKGNFSPKDIHRYSGQFLALLKSCETQDKIPNFLRDLQDCKT